MQTLVRTPGNVSAFLLEDDQPVSIEADRVTFGEPVWLIVGDCNTDNCKLFHADSAPADWVGLKYCFDGSAWTSNPDWVEPQPVENDRPIPPEPEPEPQP